MTSERALEILSAYGADPARWPSDECASCLARIARDPVLARARRDATALDAALVGWARAPLATTTDADHAVARALETIGPAAGRNTHWPARGWRPFAGAALAASVAAGLFIGGHLGPARTQARHTTVLTAQLTTTDREAFRQVFTPTPDEEDIL